jgi:hypothetical protein
MHLRKTGLSSERLSFICANENRNTDYAVGHRVTLNDQTDHVVLLAERSARPWWFSVHVYVVCVLLGMACPFRLLMVSSLVKQVEWTCEKKVSAKRRAAPKFTKERPRPMLELVARPSDAMRTAHATTAT